MYLLKHDLIPQNLSMLGYERQGRIILSELDVSYDLAQKCVLILRSERKNYKRVHMPASDGLNKKKTHSQMKTHSHHRP